MARAPDSGPDPRLEGLVDHIVVLASGDLDARLPTSGAADAIDAVIVGVNMLAEELQALGSELEERVADRTRQLEAARRTLERAALRDELTGLGNRAMLAARLDRTADRDRPYAVLVLDLDGFKNVNDTFGHAVGDRLLVAVADRLRSVVRSGDTVCRLGGDEFAVIAADTTAAEAVELASRIVSTLRNPIRVEGHVCWIGASVGVRPTLEPVAADVLLRDADVAMYTAKAEERGSIRVFEPGMHRGARRRVEMAAELRAAHRDGRFALVYQPIFELATGRISGVEALLRWRHPRRGLVEPAEFIPVAEEIGFIGTIDRWVLDTAVAQLSAWRRDPRAAASIGMHVNVSPLDLRSPHFAEDVLASLRRHGAAPGDVTLEVTETQVLGEDAGTRRSLAVLAAAGVRLAVDDFGTGHSSLGWFTRLSADVIKIDRSLVTGLDADPRRHRIAAAILAVVEAFGCAAVAEGIETAAEARTLAALGYRYGQGYHLGRPMDADAIAVLLDIEATRPLTAVQRSENAG